MKGPSTSGPLQSINNSHLLLGGGYRVRTDWPGKAKDPFENQLPEGREWRRKLTHSILNLYTSRIWEIITFPC